MFLALLLALMIPVGQAVYWLYAGVWIPFSVIELGIVLCKIAGVGQATWLHSPDAWLGLHYLLDGAHVSFLPLALAFAIGIAEDRAEADKQKAERAIAAEARRKEMEEYEERSREQAKLQEKIKQLEWKQEKEKQIREAKLAADTAKLARALLKLRAAHGRDYTLAEIYKKAKLAQSSGQIRKSDIERVALELTCRLSSDHSDLENGSVRLGCG